MAAGIHTDIHTYRHTYIVVITDVAAILVVIVLAVVTCYVSRVITTTVFLKTAQAWTYRCVVRHPKRSRLQSRSSVPHEEYPDFQFVCWCCSPHKCFTAGYANYAVCQSMQTERAGLESQHANISKNPLGTVWRSRDLGRRCCIPLHDAVA